MDVFPFFIQNPGGRKIRGAVTPLLFDRELAVRHLWAMTKTPFLLCLLLLPAALFGGADQQNTVLLTIGLIALVPFLVPLLTMLLLGWLVKSVGRELDSRQKRYLIHSGWGGALLVSLYYILWGRSDFPWYVLFGASIPFSLVGYLVACITQPRG